MFQADDIFSSLSGVRRVVFISNVDAPTGIDVQIISLFNSVIHLTNGNNIGVIGTFSDIGDATLKSSITYGNVRVAFICRCSI